MTSFVFVLLALLALPILGLGAVVDRRLRLGVGVLAVALLVLALAYGGPQGVQPLITWSDLKYLFFGLAVVMALPLMGLAAATRPAFRRWLLIAIMASTAVAGMHTGLHFVNQEGYRGLDHGFEVNLTDVLTLAACVGVLVSHGRQVRWFPYGWFPLLLMFLVSAIATWQADDQLLASFVLFKFVRVYLLYWLCANWFVVGGTVETFRRGLVVAMVIVLAMGFKQHYVNHLYAAIGPMAHQNQLCLFVLQLLPIFLLWTARDQRRSISIEMGVLALMIVALVIFTHSRAGTVLAGLEVLAALVYANIRMPSARVRRASIALLTLFAVGALHALPTMIERFQDAPEASLDGRIQFNIAAHQFAQQHAFGVGPNNFSHVLTRDWEAMGIEGDILLIEDSDQVGVCHNLYWLTAAEMGWPGLVALLIVLFTFFRLQWRGAWKTPPATACISAGMMIGALALHAQDYLEPTFYTAPILYVFAVQNGFAAALLRQQTARA